MMDPVNPNFAVLLHRLQEWRDADHEDNIVLPRAFICTLLDGVRALEAGGPRAD